MTMPVSVMDMDTVIDHLDEDGYAVIPSLLGESIRSRIVDDVENLMRRLRDGDSALSESVVFEKDYIRMRPARSEFSPDDVGDAVYLVDDLLLVLPDILPLLVNDITREFLQHRFPRGSQLLMSQLIHKEPYVGSPLAFHRDQPNKAMTLDRHDTIRILYCLDAMNEDNGPVMVLPGSHRDDVRYDAHDDRLRAITCPAGNGVILHPRLWHGSGANRSPRFRRTAVIEFADASVRITGGIRFAFAGTLCTHPVS